MDSTSWHKTPAVLHSGNIQPLPYHTFPYGSLPPHLYPSRPCPAAIYDSMVIILDPLQYQYILRLGAVEHVVVREELPPGIPKPWSRIKKSTALTLYIESPRTQATKPAPLKHRRQLISAALDRILTAFPQR